MAVDCICRHNWQDTVMRPAANYAGDQSYSDNLHTNWCAVQPTFSTDMANFHREKILLAVQLNTKV